MPLLLTIQIDRHSQLVAIDRLSLTAEERSRGAYEFTPHHHH